MHFWATPIMFTYLVFNELFELQLSQNRLHFVASVKFFREVLYNHFGFDRCKHAFFSYFSSSRLQTNNLDFLSPDSTYK